MARCSKCNAALPDGAQFCGTCGALDASAGARPIKRTILGEPIAGAMGESPAPSPEAPKPRAPMAPPRVSATIDDEADEAAPDRGAEETLEVGEVIDGKYAIVRVLGQGGMGVVYLARDVNTDLQVVLKAVRRELAHRPDLRARMLAEGRALAQIDHANVVRLNAVVAQGDDLWLVMQYINGETLDKIIASHKPLGGIPVDRAVALFRQIASGVGAAHQEGVIHRDLKPANVIVRQKDGVAKVMDFGIAKLPSRPDGAITKGVIGSLWYMSPEQVKGRRDLDARVDVYALGILLFQMLVGRVPFNGASEYEIMKLQAEAPMPLARIDRTDVPAELDAVIQRACQKDRDNRYPSCEELIAALDQLGLATPSFSSQRSADASGAHRVSLVEVHRTAADAVDPPAPTALEIEPALEAPPPSPTTPDPPSEAPAPAEIEPAVAAPSPEPEAPGLASGGVTGTGTELPIAKAPVDKPRRSGAWIAIVVALFAIGGGGAALVATGVVASPFPPTKKRVVATAAPVVTASATAAPPPKKSPLMLLVGPWVGNGRELDAVLDGDVLEFRVKNPSQFAPQDYEAGEARFALRETPEPNVFLVEDRIRPNPPPGRTYDPHSRGTCQEIWTQTNGEPLRARFDGTHLTVDFAKIEPSDGNFITSGGKITSCVELRSLKAVKVVSVLKRP